MMLKKIVFSALILGSAQLSFALTLSQEEDTLDRYYQAFENRSSELEEVENELFGYEYKLERAQKDLQAAEVELSKAQKESASAKIALASDNSDDNQRAFNLAEHALKMSERGIRTRTKRLERVENYMAELQAKQSQLEAQVADGQRRIDAQEKRLKSAQSEEASRLAEAEQARIEAESRMADEKRQAAAVSLAAGVAAPKSMASIVEAPVSTPKPAINEAAAETAASVEPKEQRELSELDQEALEYAQKEVARLEDTLSGSDPGRPTYKHLTLGGNKIETESFEFLGQDQYRVDTVVENGRQIFQVGKHKFRRTIPASDNGQEYVFIYDAKRLSRPRLVMFKKSLLEVVK